MFKIFNKISNSIDNKLCEVVDVVKYSMKFTTADGKEHTFNRFKYIAYDKIICTVPRYLMYDIKSDGYVEDDDGNMYILNNIISIEWKIDSYGKALEKNDMIVTYSVDDLIKDTIKYVEETNGE